MRADKCYVTLQAIIKLKGCSYNNIPQNTLKYSIISVTSYHLGDSLRSQQCSKFKWNDEKRRREKLVSGLINQFDYEHLSSFPPARFPAFGVALHTHATHNCLIYYYLYLAFASLRNRFVSEWVSKYKFLNFYLCAFGLAAMISDPNASSFRGCPVPLFHIPPPTDSII